MTSLHPALRGRKTAGSRPLPAPAGLSTEEVRYLELLAGLALDIGIADPEATLDGHEFSFEGIDFRLAYLPEADLSMLCLWCDFGDPDESRETECLLDLLLSNALRFDGISPMFALCPDTGLVVCSARLPLMRLHPDRLGTLVRALAADAARWQAMQAGGDEDKSRQHS